MKGTLSRTDHRILEALVRTLYGKGDPGGVLPDDMDWTAAVDGAAAYVGSMPPLERFAYRLGLRLLDWGTLPRGGRFHHLPRERREACLQRMHGSRLYLRRFHLLVLKVPPLVAIYSMPPVSRALGYGPVDCLADGETPA